MRQGHYTIQSPQVAQSRLCPKCGSGQPGSHKFCSECGAVLPKQKRVGPTENKGVNYAHAQSG
ncbi:MAG: hypothetical protein PVJ86_04815 [Phycisphaerales bacterium]|jgi:ribosomal protein S27AE